MCIIEYKTSIEVSILYRAFSSYFLTILLNELLSDTRDYDEPEILFCLPIDKRNKRGSVKVLLEVRTVGPDYGEPARICGCLDYVSPALACRFFTTVPPGKSLKWYVTT